MPPTTRSKRLSLTPHRSEHDASVHQPRPLSPPRMSTCFETAECAMDPATGSEGGSGGRWVHSLPASEFSLLEDRTRVFARTRAQAHIEDEYAMETARRTTPRTERMCCLTPVRMMRPKRTLPTAAARALQALTRSGAARYCTVLRWNKERHRQCDRLRPAPRSGSRERTQAPAPPKTASSLCRGRPGTKRAGKPCVPSLEFVFVAPTPPPPFFPPPPCFCANAMLDAQLTQCGATR